MPITKDHVHSLGYMNLIGDFLHNIIDGIVIGISYLLNIKLGIVTTIAIMFHEIPQEIGDFGVLLHSGFSKKKALILNFIVALSSFIGLLISFFLFSITDKILPYLILFAAGNFIYIANSDLIPELHKDVELKKSTFQVLYFLLGVLLLFSLNLIHFH